MNSKLLAGMIAIMTLGGITATSATGNSAKEVSAANGDQDTRIIVEVNKSLEKLSDSEIYSSQDKVMNVISNKVTKNFSLFDRYHVLNNAFVMSVNANHIDAIRALPEVKSVTIDKIHAKQELESGDYYSAKLNCSVGKTDEEPGEMVENISASTMNKPSGTNEGEGTVIAILDNEFYLRGEHDATEGDDGSSWNHVVYKPLDSSVSQKFTFENLSSLVSGKTAKTHAKRVEGKLPGEEGSLYFNTKVPFYYDYGGESKSYSKVGDMDYDVSSTLSYHGSHVASIASANADKYKGIAPKAQLACMKVFTNYKADDTGKQMGFSDSSGAYDSAILAALEDAILLGVDGINMSLGSDLGDFDGDSISMRTLDRLANDAGIMSAISAGNAGKTSYSSTGGYGNWTTDMVETGILGSYANSGSSTIVASGQPTHVYFENAIEILGQDQTTVLKNVAFEDQVVNREGLDPDFAEDSQHWMIKDIVGDDLTKIVNWQYIPGFGTATDYPAGVDVSGKVVVVNRGSTSFAEKYNIAAGKGACGIIIINNDPTATDFNFRCSFGDDFNPTIPCALALYRDKQTFENLQSGIFRFIQKRTSTNDLARTISTFSSDGAKFNYDLKPDVTTPGESIRGAVPPQKKEHREETPYSTYEYLSGTSMAAPNYAGAQSLVLSKLAKDVYADDGSAPNETELNNLKAYRKTVDMRLMSTANPMYDALPNPENGEMTYTSPRIQGAGLVDLNKAYNTDIYLEGLDLEGNPIEKSKIVLKNSEDISKGILNLKFLAHNETGSEKNYTAKVTVMRPAIKQDNQVVPDSYTLSGEVDDVSKIPALTYYNKVVDGTQWVVKKVTNPGNPNYKDVIKLTKQITYYTSEEDFNNETNPHILTQGYYYNSSNTPGTCVWALLPKTDYQSVQDIVLETYTQSVSIPAGDSLVQLDSHTISEEIRTDILAKYPYGCAIEGFVELLDSTEERQISIPYLGFYSGAEIDGKSLRDAPVVEPFSFEKDPDQIYPSDLVNDVIKSLLGKDNVEIGSTWTIGYAKSILDIDTTKVHDNDTNFEKLGTGWHKIGVDPSSGQYYENPGEHLYVGNPLKSNTMIVQQYIMRSVKDNYFTIRNENGDVVYKSVLTDMMFGDKQLYKSHLDPNYAAAHRAYAIIPLYNPTTGKAFADGNYSIEFSYQLAYDDSWVNKSYNFIVDATSPEITNIEEYTAPSGEQRVKFTISESKLSMASLGYRYVDIHYDETNDVYYIDEAKNDVKQAIAQLGKMSNGQKRLTLKLTDSAYGETNVIIHFFGFTFSNYVMAQGPNLATNNDFVKNGTTIKWYVLSGSTEKEFTPTGEIKVVTNIEEYKLVDEHKCYDNNHDGYCDYCGDIMEPEPECDHIMKDLDQDGICDVCGKEVGHVDSEGIGLCDYCGKEMEPEHDHNFAAAWSHDDNKHWHACTVEGCTVKSGEGEHTFNDKGVCTVCGYAKENPKPEKSNVGLIVGCSVGGAAVLAGAGVGLYFFLKKRKLGGK